MAILYPTLRLSSLHLQLTLRPEETIEALEANPLIETTPENEHVEPIKITQLIFQTSIVWWFNMSISLGVLYLVAYSM